MLSKTQKRLSNEIDDIIALIGLNHKEIENFENDARIPVLKSIKDHYIRGEIIMTYTLIDEMLNCIIANYYFDNKKSFIKHWRTKRFQNFNYFILEKIYLLNKLDLVKNIIKLPKGIETRIRAVNDLRNGLAHAFFPENLRRNKPVYFGKSVYTPDGIKTFVEDAQNITDFLFKKAYKFDISKYDFRVN